MIKTKTIDGDDTKRVLFEISRGGYFTEDDEVALTNYLMHLPSNNYFIVDIDVEYELN